MLPLSSREMLLAGLQCALARARGLAPRLRRLELLQLLLVVAHHLRHAHVRALDHPLRLVRQPPFEPLPTCLVSNG
jgi:hypothetical protein